MMNNGPSFEFLKEQKLAEVRQAFESKVAALKSDCAPYEVETWAIQTQEYSRWMADNTAPIPYVTAIAAGRGISVDALMAKIGAKVAGLAYLQGQQQAAEDRVKAATTREELFAVEA